MNNSKFSFRAGLGAKTLLFAVLPTVIILFGIIIYTAASTSTQTRKEVEHSMQILAGQVATEIERGNSRADLAAQIMAHAQESAGLFGKRLESAEFARRVLEELPELTGAYFGYEPNADQNDKTYLLRYPNEYKAMDSKGRFLPYWFIEDSIIELVPLIDMETSLYYEGCKKRFYSEEQDKANITEPYFYEGKMILEQTYPIVINDRFAGIAGVDRALTDLLKYLNNFKPYESSKLILIQRYTQLN